MKNYAEVVISNRGEGVMVRKPSSVYENFRSHSILKYKVLPPTRVFFGNIVSFATHKKVSMCIDFKSKYG